MKTRVYHISVSEVRWHLNGGGMPGVAAALAAGCPLAQKCAGCCCRVGCLRPSKAQQQRPHRLRLPEESARSSPCSSAIKWECTLPWHPEIIMWQIRRAVEHGLHSIGVLQPPYITWTGL